MSLNQTLLKAERERRSSGGTDRKVREILADLSDKQRHFVTSRARFKVAVCPRRAGKSRAICSYMIVTALSRSGMPVLFLSLTKDSAKSIIWDMLVGLLDQYQIPYEARPSALTVKLPNGSQITLFGADTPNARNRLRGRKFRLICVDEAAFINGQSMDALIYSLIPSLADYKGTLALASSPGEKMDGLFYHAFAGEQKAVWDQHEWDILENPYFMGPADEPTKYASKGWEELHTICDLMYGGNWEHPAFLREQRGKYVKDNSKLVYPFTDINLIDAPTPLEDAMYGIGIDFGVTSESAIVVAKFSEYSKEFQIVESWSKQRADVDELAAEIMSRQEKYKAVITVADTGGLGAATTQELRRRYSIAIKDAEKRDKVFFQRLMATDLHSGYIKAVRTLGLVDEWSKIVRGDDGEEMKGQKNHEADAALYIWRYSYTTYLKHAAPKMTEEQRMIRDLIDSVNRQKAEEAEFA